MSAAILPATVSLLWQEGGPSPQEPGMEGSGGRWARRTAACGRTSRGRLRVLSRQPLKWLRLVSTALVIKQTNPTWAREIDCVWLCVQNGGKRWGPYVTWFPTTHPPSVTAAVSCSTVFAQKNKKTRLHSSSKGVAWEMSYFGAGIYSTLFWGTGVSWEEKVKMDSGFVRLLYLPLPNSLKWQFWQMTPPFRLITFCKWLCSQYCAWMSCLRPATEPETDSLSRRPWNDHNRRTMNKRSQLRAARLKKWFPFH